jgi:hypothetical protein
MSDEAQPMKPLDRIRRNIELHARGFETGRELAAIAIVEIAHFGQMELVKEVRALLPDDAIRGVEYFVGEILAPGGASIAMTIGRMNDQARANLVPVAAEFRRQLRGD